MVKFAILSACTSTDEDLNQVVLYFKQVELDDRMLILGSHYVLPRAAANATDLLACSGLQLALHEFNTILDETVGALAAEFFFCAPIRRQAGGVFWA